MHIAYDAGTIASGYLSMAILCSLQELRIERKSTAFSRKEDFVFQQVMTFPVIEFILKRTIEMLLEE